MGRPHVFFFSNQKLSVLGPSPVQHVGVFPPPPPVTCPSLFFGRPFFSSVDPLLQGVIPDERRFPSTWMGRLPFHGGFSVAPTFFFPQFLA